MSDRLAGTHILTIDDDADIRALVSRYLEADGMHVTGASNAVEATAAIGADLPDLVLMDVDMPGTDGFTLCKQLLERPEMCSLPIVFLTARSSEQDKARALVVGGIGYIVKPFTGPSLTSAVRGYLNTAVRFCAITEASYTWSERLVPEEFVRFKEYLATLLGGDPTVRERVAKLRPDDLYLTTGPLISVAELARAIGRFLDIPRVHAIPADAVDLGVLPSAFCRSQLVVPLQTDEGPVLVIANPFNWQLLDTVERFSQRQNYKLQVAEPSVIMQLLSGEGEEGEPGADSAERQRTHSFGEMDSTARASNNSQLTEEGMTDSSPVTYIANNIIVSAASQRASDIHVEPKESSTVVRFRVDGDMRDFLTLKRTTGSMLISRFKVLGGLDIAEKRRPQDGSMEAVVGDRRYKLRLATTSTPHGESLIVRLLEAESRPQLLSELGMSPDQETKMVGFANRAHGLICVVGPTGSGKTTTIYSLISQIDADRRSIITIEDPVEYRIAKANQQQVNEKAGVTFESLLRSVVRQDPDVLFLGEIRDPFSAKMSMDFASTGHLTITSLHTTNATTALFRFERLGITRAVMAEALLAIVAQRLIKRLCSRCKTVDPISAEERAWMEPFTDDIPDQVAHPVGCPACGNTGYLGREAVNEIFEFDPQVLELVRTGVSVPEIREFVRRRGDYLLYDHAIDKVRQLVFAPVDVWQHVLVEEAALSADGADIDHIETEEGQAELRRSDTGPSTVPSDAAAAVVPEAAAPSPAARLAVAEPMSEASESPAAAALQPLVLLVDDDPDTLTLLERTIGSSGYTVVPAHDGGTALLELGRRAFDLVISDLDLPGLDGFTLLQIMAQQGVKAPVMFLTGSDTEEDEARGFELGAVDFMHKPIRPDVLLARMRRALVSTQRA